MSIGKNIQHYRKIKGYSQRELADILGVATGTIQQYELDKREPKFEMVLNIAKELDTKPYLIYGTEDIPDETESKFTRSCEWLEESGFTVSKPDEDDYFQKYSINDFEHGTICKMDKIDIINMVEKCVNEANETRDKIAIGYIKEAVFSAK